MISRPLLDIVVLDTGGTVRMLLAGELDLSGVRGLRSAVNRILDIPGVRRIEVDAALLDFCDSTGLGALMEAQQCATERFVPLYLTDMPPRLRRLLDTTGLGRRLAPPPWPGPGPEG
ncbi:STAS domain-containing protein [Streptacidiphilus sp. PAMC 29251]|jgi:anti-sigma B factor antagonist